VNASPDDQARLIEHLERCRRREEKAKREPVGGLWRTIGRVNALGWHLALPIALGAFVGNQIDNVLGSGIAWSLGFLVLGLAAGLYLLWRALRSEQEE